MEKRKFEQLKTLFIASGIIFIIATLAFLIDYLTGKEINNKNTLYLIVIGISLVAFILFLILFIKEKKEKENG